MTDKVNQLPGSPIEDPLEESLAQNDSFVHTGALGMDTSSHLEKETNAMTRDDLDRLREEHSFPSRI